MSAQLSRVNERLAGSGDALNAQPYPPLDAYDEPSEAAVTPLLERAETGESAAQHDSAHAAGLNVKRLPSLDWTALEGGTPPLREWALHQWMGMGHVTLLGGAPGAGKTTVAQAIGACLSIGADYLEEVLARRRVLMWASEDDDAQLWRNQIAIAQWLGVSLGDFAGRFELKSYDGEEVVLAGTVDQRRIVPTAMYRELCEQIGDYKSDVVILDNIARLYAGSENERHHVTSFVAMLTAAARPTKAAVLLLGHPGKAAGSEYSGSTAWEGSVRARLYLGRKLPDVDTGEEAEDDTTRYLCRRKANYSARDWRRLEYRDGVMVPEQEKAGLLRAGPEYARDVVARAMRKLAGMDEHGTASTSSPHYLPRLAKQYELLENVPERQFAAAMREMRKEGTIAVATVGQYANRTPRQGLVLASEVHK